MHEPGTKTVVDQLKDHSGKPVTVLRINGDISSASRQALLGAYEQLNRTNSVSRAGGALLLDFSKVDYINSSGIALVIQLIIAASKGGERVGVFGLTPHFQKVFTMVGIPKYAALYQDENSAKSAMAA